MSDGLAERPDAPPAAHRWGLGYVCAAAALRALALALSAAALSAVRPGHLPGFVATWSLALLPLFACLGALEAPLLGALLRADGRAPRLIGPALWGLLWGLVLGAVAPIARAFSWLGWLALGAAGMLAGQVAAPPAGWSPRWGLGALAASAALALGLLIADPEGAYNARYEVNRAAVTGVAVADPGRASALELAEALADTWLASHEPEALTWSWEEAVALEGQWALSELRDLPARRRLEAFTDAWIEAHRNEALRTELWADAAAPAGIVLRRGPEPIDAPIVARVRSYLLEEAPRTRDGVISHLGLVAGGWLPRQAWVDSLFMHGVSLNRLGRRNDLEAIKASQALAEGMARALQDPETGLFRHAAIDLGPARVTLPVEACYWARGNAWVAWYLVDYLEAERQMGLRETASLRSLLDALAPALLRAQDPESGLWPTDLSLAEPAPGDLEVSASALILAALLRGRRLGLIPAEDAAGRSVDAAIERGLAALRGRLIWRAGGLRVLGTSVGTHPGFRAYYQSVAQDENVGHGVGAALLALTESIKAQRMRAEVPESGQ